MHVCSWTPVQKSFHGNHFMDPPHTKPVNEHLGMKIIAWKLQTLHACMFMHVCSWTPVMEPLSWKPFHGLPPLDEDPVMKILPCKAFQENQSRFFMLILSWNILSWILFHEQQLVQILWWRSFHEELFMNSLSLKILWWRPFHWRPFHWRSFGEAPFMKTLEWRSFHEDPFMDMQVLSWRSCCQGWLMSYKPLYEEFACMGVHGSISCELACTWCFHKQVFNKKGLHEKVCMHLVTYYHVVCTTC